MTLDLMFPNDEAILSFMEMTQEFHSREKPNDTYNREMKKRKEEALKQAIAEIDQDPKHPGYWNILGSLYLEQKQYNEAISSFLKAIEIDPTYKAFWNNLSIAYYQIGEKKKALDCFKEGLQLEKDHGSIMTEGLGFILQGKTLDEFLLDIDQFAKENIPAQKFYFLITLTNYYIGIQNSTLALKCLIRLVRFDSRNPQLYFNIANCFWKLGDEEKSINFLKKALGVNPDDLNVLDTLVTIHFKRNEYRDAKKYLQQMLVIIPKDTEIILDLACVHAKLKEKKETIHCLKKCLKIDSSYLPQIVMDPDFIPYLGGLEEIIEDL